ncbi:MAG: hypothetical protein ABJB47_15520 [Actinomycetota bacterium]
MASVPFRLIAPITTSDTIGVWVLGLTFRRYFENGSMLSRAEQHRAQDLGEHRDVVDNPATNQP